MRKSVDIFKKLIYCYKLEYHSDCSTFYRLSKLAIFVPMKKYKYCIRIFSNLPLVWKIVAIFKIQDCVKLYKKIYWKCLTWITKQIRIASWIIAIKIIDIKVVAWTWIIYNIKWIFQNLFKIVLLESHNVNIKYLISVFLYVFSPYYFPRSDKNFHICAKIVTFTLFSCLM